VVQRAYRVIPDAGASLNPRLVPIAEAAFYREVVPAAATWPPRMGREASRSGESGGALWLGEHHNSAKDHALQAALIRRLAQDPRREGPVGIGLEQVQVQFQPVLDAYLRREIKMEEMRQQVEWDRRWVWPFENYRSIFEAARELGAPLVALNVNSEDMTAVERQGFAGLSRRKIDQYIPDASGFAEFAARRSFSAYVEYVIQPSYALHRAMGLLEHTMTGEKLEEEMPFRDFLSGRLLWDEAMASRAYSWTRANPNGLLIGLVGAGMYTADTLGCRQSWSPHFCAFARSREVRRRYTWSLRSHGCSNGRRDQRPSSMHIGSAKSDSHRLSTAWVGDRGGGA
jgi:hypothetical protein